MKIVRTMKKLYLLIICLGFTFVATPTISSAAVDQPGSCTLLQEALLLSLESHALINIRLAAGTLSASEAADLQEENRNNFEAIIDEMAAQGCEFDETANDAINLFYEIDRHIDRQLATRTRQGTKPSVSVFPSDAA